MASFICLIDEPGTLFGFVLFFFVTVEELQGVTALSPAGGGAAEEDQGQRRQKRRRGRRR